MKTIDAQLKDIPLQQIREKESLILDRSIGEIQAAVQKGALSYTELTAFYLDRIKRFDKAEHGINAVMEVNPHAIAIARQLDEGRAQAASPFMASRFCSKTTSTPGTCPPQPAPMP